MSLGGILSLILIGRLLQLRELLLTQSLGFFDLARLFFYLSPFFMLLLMPVACMMSVFLVFLRMSNDRELLALKAGGASLFQLLPAPLLFCLLCTAANFGIAFQGVSWGMEHFRSAIMDIARTKTQLTIQAGVFNREFPGLTIYAQSSDPLTGDLEMVFVRDATRQNIEGTILAPVGKVISDPAKGEVQIVLSDGKIYREEGDKIGVLDFSSYLVRLDLSRLLKDFGLDAPKPKELSWKGLKKLLNDPATQSEDGGNLMRKIMVEQHKRFAFPLACLALGLFALPLACSFQGLRQSIGVAMVLGFFLVYYVLLSLGLTLGEAGRLEPAIGMWLPNAMFLVAAIHYLNLTAMERTPLPTLLRPRVKPKAACDQGGNC